LALIGLYCFYKKHFLQKRSAAEGIQAAFVVDFGRTKYFAVFIAEFYQRLFASNPP
jgi:hypothetical protein